MSDCYRGGSSISLKNSFRGRNRISKDLPSDVLKADIENDGILVMDLLTAHNCDLMLSQSCRV